jgi:hypothetical protein
VPDKIRHSHVFPDLVRHSHVFADHIAELRPRIAESPQLSTSPLLSVSFGSDTWPASQRRLTHMRDFYAFLLDEIPALLDRWHQRSGRPS